MCRESRAQTPKGSGQGGVWGRGTRRDLIASARHNTNGNVRIGNVQIGNVQIRNVQLEMFKLEMFKLGNVQIGNEEIFALNGTCRPP